MFDLLIKVFGTSSLVAVLSIPLIVLTPDRANRWVCAIEVFLFLVSVIIMIASAFAVIWAA